MCLAKLIFTSFSREIQIQWHLVTQMLLEATVNCRSQIHHILFSRKGILLINSIQFKCLHQLIFFKIIVLKSGSGNIYRSGNSCDLKNPGWQLLLSLVSLK